MKTALCLRPGRNTSFCLQGRQTFRGLRVKMARCSFVCEGKPFSVQFVISVCLGWLGKKKKRKQNENHPRLKLKFCFWLVKSKVSLANRLVSKKVSLEPCYLLQNPPYHAMSLCTLFHKTLILSVGHDVLPLQGSPSRLQSWFACAASKVKQLCHKTYMKTSSMIMSLEENYTFLHFLHCD